MSKQIKSNNFNNIHICYTYFRLLSRVFEADGIVSVNSLFASFELEAKDARIEPNIS